MRNLGRLVALALATNALSVSAQEPAEAPIPASVDELSQEARCELHAWPGNGLRSTYHGWLHGGIVDGAVQGREGYPSIPEQPLPTSRQIEVMREMPLADLLGLSGYQVVLHDYALDSRSLRITPGRLVQSSGACLAELIIDDVFFQEDVFSGRYLKLLARFRQFGEAEAPERSFGTYIQEKLELFPPRTPQADSHAAIEELGTAFATVIEKFAFALNKPAKKSRN